ncbi:BCCT family transporter [Desmospora activa]|uniref:Choline/carnitine/betaine transport n=1 Tax=Desmospora activa DSM 45169 TaxID=1121389 RepID=A0A2T4ZBQ6_9BACL|nr:BCCT family transporter [Desmospora activa]PTM59323.1 choline/carnitine/betaine transport [Desmospora activa DSM 45169]
MKNNKPLGPVFWVSTITIFLLVIWGVSYPAQFENVATSAKDFANVNFAWFYLLSTFLFVSFCLFMAFSKYGKIRLGRDHERPEYPFFTWVGMLFSCGFGVGLVFWGVAEPMTHFFSPPIGGLEEQSPAAARVAMQYAFFHWGISQWSAFTIVGLAIAYFQFRKQEDGLISTTFNPLIGKGKKPLLRKSIDTIAVIATVMGVATSLGQGILQINGGLHSVFGTPADNNYMYLAIIGVLLALYLTSSITGLDKGIKYLSNLNLGLALALMTFVFLTGPSVFILESFILGIGDYLQNFVQLSFRLTPYTESTWVYQNTIFYWAWVIAWSPFVGAFVARVSRGRTIREFVMGVLIIPPMLGLVWIAVFGGTALNLDLFHGTQIAEAVNQNLTTSLFVTFNELPLSFLLSVMSILLIFTFLITSADSATYILGSMTSHGSLNPQLLVKVIWGILIAAIAGVLLKGGLDSLQSASLVAALPFTLLLFIVATSLVKAINAEKKSSSEETKKVTNE